MTQSYTVNYLEEAYAVYDFVANGNSFVKQYLHILFD